MREAVKGGRHGELREFATPGAGVGTAGAFEGTRQTGNGVDFRLGRAVDKHLVLPADSPAFERLFPGVHPGITGHSRSNP